MIKDNKIVRTMQLNPIPDKIDYIFSHQNVSTSDGIKKTLYKKKKKE